jgi:hypothetical protein
MLYIQDRTGSFEFPIQLNAVASYDQGMDLENPATIVYVSGGKDFREDA